MAFPSLSGDQLEAVRHLRVGSILNGGVGSGKSRTAIGFYYAQCGGQLNAPKYTPMKYPRDLYIITTAQKRDKLEWEGELAQFCLSTNPQYCIEKVKIIVDSWNNIKKYADIKDAFFIFDEQRVVGYGVWTHSFLKIAAKNKWILLTATPGDCWMDYIPVFIANGFYKHKTDFIHRHVVYSRFTKYPKVEKYINEAILLKHRNDILVNMEFKRKTIPHHEDVMTDYDKPLYDYVVHNRWNVYEDKPIEHAGEYCLVLRKIVNCSPDRQIKLIDLVRLKKKVIIFYNYDYELELLRKLFTDTHYPFAEWNGHKHEKLLEGDHWVYLVQYTAGAEGWNCITTDTIIFFSQSYSYKQMVQAAGRIDRRNTPYVDLYYFHLKSSSKIDRAISKVLHAKKQFSEKGFAPEFKSDSLPQKPSEPKPYRMPNSSDPYISTSNPYTTSEPTNKNPIKIEDYCKIYNSWEDPNNVEQYAKANGGEYGGAYAGWGD